MSISSISNSSTQLAQLSQTKTEGKIEGNKPDGDRDKDDLSQSNAITQSSSALQTTGSIGRNLNIVA